MQVSAGSINKTRYLIVITIYFPLPCSRWGLDQKRSLSAVVEVVAYFFFSKEGKTPITQEFKSIT